MARNSMFSLNIGKSWMRLISNYALALAGLGQSVGNLITEEQCGAVDEHCTSEAEGRYRLCLCK